MLQVPVRLGGLQQRLRQRQAGVVDDEVDPAEGEHRGVDRGLHGGLVGDVGRDADRDVGVADLGGRRACALSSVEVGDDDAGALGGEPRGDGLADARAAPVTRAMRVASGFGFGIRCELGLFQRPVLDAELLATRRSGA